MKKQTRPENSVTFSRQHTDRQPVKPPQDIAILEFLAGDGSGEEVYNIEGARLADNVVIYRRPYSQFVVYTKLGTEWFETVGVKTGDPAIEALRDAGMMIVCGPSPSQLEQQRRREEEERAMREYHEEMERKRAEHRRQMRERAEARRGGVAVEA